jgi:hypothetical protein
MKDGALRVTALTKSCTNFIEADKGTKGDVFAPFLPLDPEVC